MKTNWSICCFLAFSLFTSVIHAQEYGKASYYDPSFQGAKTASGEAYDGSQYTAAHKLHPFGTRLKVTRQDDGRSVIVRVNDRGPHIKGRIIDLSLAAAQRLGMVSTGSGVVDVMVEVVSTGTGGTSGPVASSGPATAATNQPSVTSYNDPTITAKGPTTTPPSASPSVTPASQTPQLPVTNNQNTSYDQRLLKGGYESFGLYEIKILQVNKAGYGVQVSSLSTYDNAMHLIADLQGKGMNNVLLNIEEDQLGSAHFKVIIGPYATKEAALSSQNTLKSKHKMGGFVIDLSTIE